MLNKDFSVSKYMFFQEQYLDSFWKNISKIVLWSLIDLHELLQKSNLPPCGWHTLAKIA